ncbi:MAG TPA: hypothetical protein VHC19_10610 [Pirellulales bacterium]|nr:hypothetical protein [Pirellulales bacterium]
MSRFDADKEAPISLAGVLMVRIFVGTLPPDIIVTAVATMTVRVLANRRFLPRGCIRSGEAHVLMVPATPDQGVNEEDRRCELADKIHGWRVEHDC